MRKEVIEDGRCSFQRADRQGSWQFCQDSPRVKVWDMRMQVCVQAEQEGQELALVM